MDIGVTAGLIGMLGVVAIYFWIVRRAEREPVDAIVE
jgi:hypothetical protein